MAAWAAPFKRKKDFAPKLNFSQVQRSASHSQLELNQYRAQLERKDESREEYRR